MKRFLTATVLCGGLLLLLFGFVLIPGSGAQQVPPRPKQSVVPALLAVPAPPPPNPFWRPSLTNRDEDFYDRKRPPSDDAPTEDLLDYWRQQNQFDPKYTYTVKPSERSVSRILAEIAKKPESLPDIINSLPESRETAEFVKRLYDEAASNKKFDPSWRDAVRKWMTYHTPYFSGELAGIASNATDSNGYVTNQDEVLALARVDFEKAQPLLDQMLADSSKPVSQTLARWAYYKHAVAVGDSLGADSYRRALQQTVEDKSAGPGNRDLAMDAIVESGDFPGRDDWYLSLMEDETLHDLRVNGQTYTGLTTIINHSPNDKYLPKMIELASSASKVVRTAAVRNLLAISDSGIKSPELARALLPWLEDKDWVASTAGDRGKVVALLSQYEIPESVNGLVAMLNERVEIRMEKREEATGGQRTLSNAIVIPEAVRAATANSAVIAANIGRSEGTVRDPAPSAGRVEYSYPFRSAAINALAKQKSSFAAGPLRQLLSVVEIYERPELIKAILVSNGFTLNEQLMALEFYVDKTPVESESNAAPSAPVTRGQVAPAEDLKYQIALQLLQIETPSDELVRALIDRISALETRKPRTAQGLRGIIENWKGPAINSMFLRDLRDGRATADQVVTLLAIRKELRERQLDEINAARAGDPASGAITSCILEDANEFAAIIDGDSVDAKAALLACARLIRGPIPVAKVAPLMASPDKTLAFAAEQYLISEDSPAARHAVLERHPKDILILGATTGFMLDAAAQKPKSLRDLYASVNDLYRFFEPYQLDVTDDSDIERELRTDLKKDEKLVGVYAYDSNFIKLYADGAVFSWRDDPARYRERKLTPQEFSAFTNFLGANRVDELPPFLSPCDGCGAKSLLMLGKAGGRRVFVHADPLPPFFEQLERILEAFRAQPAEQHYVLEKDIKDLRVHYADPAFDVVTLWKNGGDFRLLLQDSSVRKELAGEEGGGDGEYDVEGEGEDEEPGKKETPEEAARREKARRDAEVESYMHQYSTMRWVAFDGAKVGADAVQPDAAPYVPQIDGFNVLPSTERWKTMAPGIEVRIADDGLYKIAGGKMSRITSGTYANAVVSTNGRWALTVKYAAPGVEEFQPALYRVNLATGRETRVNLPPDTLPVPLAYDPFVNRFVLGSGYTSGEDGEAESIDVLLLDPDTGAALPFRGEASPLLQQTFRALQGSSAGPEIVWAAVPDGDGSTAVGTYNLKTLTFKKWQRLPNLAFDSMALWVDEAEMRAYVVYLGQLISFPLTKPAR